MCIKWSAFICTARLTNKRTVSCLCVLIGELASWNLAVPQQQRDPCVPGCCKGSLFHYLGYAFDNQAELRFIYRNICSHITVIQKKKKKANEASFWNIRLNLIYSLTDQFSFFLFFSFCKKTNFEKKSAWYLRGILWRVLLYSLLH